MMAGWICPLRLLVPFLSLCSLASAETFTLHGQASYLHFDYPSDAGETADTGWSANFQLRTDSVNGFVFGIFANGVVASVELHDGQLVLTTRPGEVQHYDASQLLDGTFKDWTIAQAADDLVTTVSVRSSSGDQIFTANATSEQKLEAAAAEVFIGGTGAHSGYQLSSPPLAACVEDVRLPSSGEVTDPSDLLALAGSCEWCDSSQCQAGTTCFAEASAAGCNCADSGKSGTKCGQDAIIASFPERARWSKQLNNGREEYCNSTTDRDIYVQVKTLSGNGTLLRLVRDGDEEITAIRLALRNGFVAAELDRMDGGAPVVVQSATKVNDNAWHSIQVTIGDGVTLKVDADVAVASSNAGEAFPLCLTGLLVVGGDFPNATGSDYVGCMRGLLVGYTALFDRRYDDETEKHRGVAHYRRPLLSDTCVEHLLGACTADNSTISSVSLILNDAQSGVSFSRVAVSTHAELEFTFRLEEHDGLLLSAYGDDDYLFVQIEDAQLCVLARAGGAGAQGMKLCTSIAGGVSGTEYYRGRLHKSGSAIDVFVNKQHEGTMTLGSAALHVDHELVWGRLESPCAGVGNRSTLANAPELKPGYRGCIGNLRMNGFCVSRTEDFKCTSSEVNTAPAGSGDSEPQSGGIFMGCLHYYCDTNECKNDGRCVSRLTRFTCNCRETGYLGERCETPGPTLTFFGGESVTRTVPNLEVSEFFFLYRSWRQSDEVVALATAYEDGDVVAFRIYQDGDSVTFHIRTADGWNVLEVEQPGLSTSFEYHKVKIQMRASSGGVGTDLVASVTAAGGRPNSGRLYLLFTVYSITRVEFGVNSTVSGLPAATAFRGHLREFVINSVDTTAEAAALIPPTVSSAEVGELPFLNYTTFFATPAVAKELPLLTPLERIVFRFRTPVADDAVLFDADFVTLLLKRRRIVLLIRSVAENPESQVRTYIREASKLNDREWHSIDVVLNHTTLVATISVDGHQTTLEFLNSDVLKPNKLAFGGALTTARYDVLPVKQGYQGCIEAVWINDVYADLHKATALNRFSDSDILERCPACLPISPCYNEGVCVDNLDESYTCQCSGTGFVGPRCLQEATTATVKQNTTLTLDLAIEEATPRSLVFLYRSWEQDSTMVNLATLRSTDSSPAVLIQQVASGIRVLVAAAGAGAADLIEAATIPISDVSTFEYKKISVSFPKPGDAAANQFNVTVDSGSPVGVDLPGSPLQLGSIEFGLPLRGGAAADGASLSGHLRDVLYNHYSVVDAISNGDRQVTSNATVGEETFTDYVIHYLVGGSHHQINTNEAVHSLAFSIIPSNMDEDSVLLDVNGHEYGSIQLLVFGGVLQLQVTNDPDFESQTNTATLPVLSTQLWTPISVTIDNAGKTVEMTVNSASRSVDFPSSFDATELLRLTVGGASPTRLTALGNATSSPLAGYRGCVKTFAINDDSAELLPSNAVDVNDSVSTVLPQCLACNVFNETCHTGGRCINEDDLTFKCDCSLTGKSGKHCLNEPAAVTFNASGSLIYNVSQSGDEAVADVSFYFRLWQSPQPQPKTLLVSVIGAASSYDVVQEDNAKLAVHRVAAGTRVSLGSVEYSLANLNEIRNFQYLPVRFTLRKNSLRLKVGGNDAFDSDIDAFSAVKVHFGMPASDELDSPVGHFKQIIINTAQIITDASTVSSGVSLGELPFDTYTISFTDATVSKSATLDKPVESVQIAIRPRPSENDANAWALLTVRTGDLVFSVMKNAGEDSVTLTATSTDGNTVGGDQPSVSVPLDVSMPSKWQNIALAIQSDKATITSESTETLSWGGSLNPAKQDAESSVTVGGPSVGLPGYLGCVESMFVNSEYVDLHSLPVSGLAEDVEPEEQTSVVAGCPECQFSSPCQHGGVCVDLPRDQVGCECDTTAYRGVHCAKRATSVTMFGNSSITYSPSPAVTLRRFYLHFRQWQAAVGDFAVLARLSVVGQASVLSLQADRDMVRLVEGESTLAELAIENAGKFRYSLVSVDLTTNTLLLAESKVSAARNDRAVAFTPSASYQKALASAVVSESFVGHMREITVNDVHVLDSNQTQLDRSLLSERSFDPYTVSLTPESFLALSIDQELHTMELSVLLPSSETPGMVTRIAGIGTPLGFISLLAVDDTLKIGVASDQDGNGESVVDFPQPVASIQDDVNRRIRLHANQQTRIIRVTVSTGDGQDAVQYHLNVSHLTVAASDDSRGTVTLGHPTDTNAINFCIENLYVNKEPQNLHDELSRFEFSVQPSAARSRPITTFCELCTLEQQRGFCRNGGECSRGEDEQRYCTCSGQEFFGLHCEQSVAPFTFHGRDREVVTYPKADSGAASRRVSSIQFSFRAWNPLGARSVVTLVRDGGAVAWLYVDYRGIWLAADTTPGEPVRLREFPRRPAFEYIPVDVVVNLDSITTTLGEDDAVTIRIVPGSVKSVQFGKPAAVEQDGQEQFRGHIKDVLVNEARLNGRDDDENFALSQVSPGEEDFNHKGWLLADSFIRIPLSPHTDSLSFLVHRDSDTSVGDGGAAERTVAVLSSSGQALLTVLSTRDAKLKYVVTGGESVEKDASDGWTSTSVTLRPLQGEIQVEERLFKINAFELDDASLLLGKAAAGSPSTDAYVGCVQHVRINDRVVDMISSGDSHGTPVSTCPLCRIQQQCSRSSLQCALDNRDACVCDPGKEGADCNSDVSFATLFGNNSLQYRIEDGSEHLQFSYRAWPLAKLTHILALQDINHRVTLHIQETEDCVRVSWRTAVTEEFQTRDVFCDSDKMRKFEYRTVDLGLSRRQATTYIRLRMAGEPDVEPNVAITDGAFPPHVYLSTGIPPGADAFPKDYDTGVPFTGHFRSLMLDGVPALQTIGSDPRFVAEPAQGEIPFVGERLVQLPTTAASATPGSIATTQGAKEKSGGGAGLWWIPIIIVILIILIIIIIVIVYRRYKKQRDEKREREAAEKRGESDA
eukprot:scpid2282/ scgid15045/ Neurexin-1a-alpha; Neurexin Ia-alpha